MWTSLKVTGWLWLFAVTWANVVDTLAPSSIPPRGLAGSEPWVLPVLGIVLVLVTWRVAGASEQEPDTRSG